MFAKFLRYILMSSSLILMVHCGPGGEFDTDSAKTRFKIKSNAESAQKNVNIQCKSPKNCPEFALGLVGIREVNEGSEKEYEVYGCSGTLIEKDEVLTNRHCLPKLSSRVGDQCNGLDIITPKSTDTDATRTECKEIIAISDDLTGDTADRPDWVVIRLKKSLSLDSAKSNNTGVAAFQPLISYPVTFSIIGTGENVSMQATIEKNECDARMEHLVSRKYNHPKSYVIAGVCKSKVVNGNSGSGLFNQNMDLLGLMNAGVQKMNPEDNNTYYFGKSIHFPRLSFMGNNLHCIPYFNQSRDAACAYTKYAYSDNIGEEMSKMHAHHINQQQASRLQEYLKQNNAIQWEVHLPSFIRSLYIDKDEKEVRQRVEYPSYQFAREQAIRQTFPYTPKCISLNHADQGVVEFMHPIMLQDKKLSFVSEDNFYTIPLFLEEIPMVAKYDSNLKRFAVQIAYPELSEAEEKQWIEKRNELMNQYNTCVNAKTPEVCSSYAQLETSFYSQTNALNISTPEANAIELQLKNQLLDISETPTSYVDNCD